MPHLTETDLARITTMPQDAQHIPLNAYLDSKPRATYRPVRECFSDIFNVQYPLLNTTLPQTKWPIIESKIRQSCWSQKLIKANLAVAKGLHDFVCAHDVVTRSQAFMPFSLGAIGSVVYWLPLILAYEGRALVPFIDPRRRMRLTPQGWRFVFSVMHERIRVSKSRLYEYPVRDHTVRRC